MEFQKVQYENGLKKELKMNSLQNDNVPLVPFVPFVQCTSGTNSTNRTSRTNEHRYSLEKGSKKHHCPDCNKKTFVFYTDTETGAYLPEKYGRCDRECKCSYHLNPYLDGYAKMIWEQEQKVTGVTKVTVPKQKYSYTQSIPQPQPEAVLFDFETFKQTLQPERYKKNTFIQNLLCREQFPFDVDEITRVTQLYRLGTIANGYRAGANTFPFIDIRGNVRTIQVKQFDKQNRTTGTDFLHSIIEKYHTRNNEPLPVWLEAYLKQEKRISCLFGEHLLSKYPNNPVALVEAPKTAIYCWLYFNKSNISIYKDCIWLAVYNRSSFSFDKLKILQGRFVYVLPDLSKDGSTFKEWEAKAKEYEKRLPGTHFIMDNILERYGTPEQREQGSDIADVLNFDWRTIRVEPDPPQAPQPEPKVEFPEPVKREQPENWSNEIVELENYFAGINLPTQPIKLNNCSIITDYSLFIENHFATVKTNNGKRTFLPYLNRLQELKQILPATYLKN